MSGTFTARDRQVARTTHILFAKANATDWRNGLIWLFTRPLGLFIYNVLIPFATAYCLQAIITKHFDQVSHYAVEVLVLALAYCVLWGVGGVAISRNGVVGSERIQREVFENYLKKDYEFFNNTMVGTLGTQATRLREAYNEYNTIIINNLVRIVIIVVFSIAIIGYQSWQLALVTVISMLLVLSFTIGSTKWRFKYRRLLSQDNSALSGVVGDALGHGTTVKSFASEDYEVKRLNTVLSRLVHSQYWSWMSSIPPDMGRMFLAALATFLLLILTSRLYQHGSISIAIVVLVQLYVIKLVLVTQDIADLVKSYEATMSAAHQAVKTMLIEPTIIDPVRPVHLPRQGKLTIAFNNVDYRYTDSAKGVKAVRKFDLTIKPGEKIGLVGYSGSGKTTLTKLLLRFMDVTGGQITIDGIDVRDLSQKDLRQRISYVPQEPLLFHRTIFENIAYGRPAANKKAVLQNGKRAYVDEFIKELPNGYETLVGERGVKLSGGQRQRVAIARALLKDAPILVLDEATSSLDSKSEQYIQKALLKLMEKRTALVIAHRLSTIQHMDRIVVMDKGKIVETGTHQQLLKKKPGIYAQLWAHQSGGYIGVKNTKTDTV